MKRILHRVANALSFVLTFLGIILAAGGCEAENSTAIVIGVISILGAAVIANIIEYLIEEIYDNDDT